MSPDDGGNTESVLNVLLTEFGAVREEILATINMQYTILSLGTGLLAGLFGVALSQSANPASLYLLFLVPFVSVAVSALWAVEGIRRLRASSYVHDELSPKVDEICQAQASIKKTSDARLLGYEFFLRKKSIKDLMRWNNSYYRLSQVGILGIFMGSGLAAWCLALFLIVIPQAETAVSISRLVGFAVLVMELGAMLYVGYIVRSVIEASRKLI